MAATPTSIDFSELESHRRELTAYCYRMLGSPFEAEDAVQETLLRAWKAVDRFEGRSQLRSWLYRIATNVCFDMLGGEKRRARPMDMGPAGEPVAENLRELPEVTWIEPLPTPEDAAESSESVRLAFVAALQHLPAKQRAALILCEVLHWKAAEAAELLETTTAGINSALQRARATLETAEPSGTPATQLNADERALLDRFVDAFQRYDISLLTDLLAEDVQQNMPPFDLWLKGREDVFTWWFGPGIGCKDSIVIPAPAANGSPAFGQYKPAENGEGHEPWALIVVTDIQDGKIADLTFFLDTERLFPLFGLPLRPPG